MSLRPYQNDFNSAIKRDRDAGISHLLGVLPCGGGKTVCFANLPKVLDLQRGSQIFLLVGRDELVSQSYNKFSQYNPTLRIGIEQAGDEADPNCDVIIASVQSVGRNKLLENGTWEWCKRLHKFDVSRVKLVIVDEGHHCVPSNVSYASTLRFLQVYKPEPKYDDPSKTLLLVTASPNRSDGIGLDQICDKITYSRDMRTMIDEKWLCDLIAYRVDTTVNIDDVPVNAGDFSRSGLSKKINTPARNKLIVTKYQELGEGQRALGFTADIQHSVDLAKSFNDAGIRAYALHSGNKDHKRTSDTERRQVLRLFRDGYYRVVLSAGILIEGFDDPGAVVGLGTAPTKSQTRLQQSVGRIARPYPSPEELIAMRAAGKVPPTIKKYGIWIDFADNTSRHKIATIPSLFGLKDSFNAKGKPMAAAIGEMERVISQKNLPLTVSDYDSVEHLKATVERVDLFAKPTIPDVCRLNSKLAWVASGPGAFQLCLPDYKVLRIAENMLGKWEISESLRGVRTVVGVASDIGSALAEADRRVPQDARGALVAEAKWRHEAPSVPQIQLAYKILPDLKRGLTFEQFTVAIKSKYTKGDLSTLLSQSPRIAQIASYAGSKRR